jgi:hypothetical protein
MVGAMNVPEARLDQSEHGLVCTGPGRFVVNTEHTAGVAQLPGMGC